MSTFTCVNGVDLFAISSINFLEDWHQPTSLNILLHLKASQSGEA
ncbi:hypothetical protein MES5069_650038 [Mesorhizobium escarrei]|uniref:Uncharacterized protein n=1 Tax=Mesorhizobium escarrei TaxID=666018 RepID=A0ABM9EFM4_9HYPH|nr:hypothetical protein MES5069_650038 [Mesorhizobium escarrei]